MGIENLPLFIVTGLLLNLAPGPDVLFIVANGLKSARAGVVAALGITAGCCVHIVAAAAGVSAVIAASTTAFTVLKWIGAAYLVYVGASMLLTRARQAPAQNLAAADARTLPLEPLAPKALLTIFKQGFWTNVLNPKVALFFLAFLPQFIAPDASHKTLSFLLLGLLFSLNSVPVNVGYALAASWVSRRLSTGTTGMGGLATWLQRAAGGLFVYFGVRLGLSEVRA